MTPQELTEIQKSQRRKLTEIEKAQRRMGLLEEKVCQLANIKGVWRWGAAVDENVAEDMARIEKSLDAIAHGLGVYFEEVPAGAERCSCDESTQAKN